MAAEPIQVWTLDLDAVTAPDAAIAPHLSDAERARAAAFALPIHRRRFLVSHGFLRAVLRDCLGEAPIEFGHSERGKPFLAGGAARGLHFSLSHSGPVAACAVGPRDLGVDVECDREIPESGAIAARIFSASGLARWQTEAPSRQLASLFAGWTRFEALAKAQGGGIVAPPEPIDHEGATDRWSAVVNRGRPWSVITMRPGQDTTLSLAIAGGPEACSVRAWQWPPESATLRDP